MAGTTFDNHEGNKTYYFIESQQTLAAVLANNKKRAATNVYG